MVSWKSFAHHTTYDSTRLGVRRILPAMNFEIQKRLSNALGRAGRLETPHGVIETLAFVAVGTKATVKALTPHEVKETGAQVVLGNTYHLYLEPGEEIVKEAGGIGKFMGWGGPTLTDSGGFQVFSLGADFDRKIGKVRRHQEIKDIYSNIPQNSGIEEVSRGQIEKLAKIDEDGVTFRSYKDGSAHRFTPERSIEIQHDLGADIIFAFDECTSPDAPYEYQKEAMERTHRWAERSLTRHYELKQSSTLNREKGRTLFQQQIFGIVQGGRFEDLRKESAKAIGRMHVRRSLGEGRDFDGFGIGGSFDKEDMGNAVRWVNELLPEEKPRHLLGIGDPIDLFDAVENGCDLFDCVAPTREARNGSLYTKRGRFNIENAKYRTDFTPIEDDCECYTCKNFTRAYLAHLFRSKEILSNTLATIHNLHFIVQLVGNMRSAILDEDFFRFRDSFLKSYTR